MSAPASTPGKRQAKAWLPTSTTPSEPVAEAARICSRSLLG